MTRDTTEPKILFASANFGLAPAAFRSVEYLGQFARNAGYNGVEMHPLLHGPEAVIKAMQNDNIDIVSLHQSFRAVGEELGTNQIEIKQTLPDALFASFIGSAIMPSMKKSAIGMNAIQSAVGHRLPGVFYPQSDAIRDKKYLSLAETSSSMYQPTDHVAYLLGSKTVEHMLETTEERGYDGLCLDTFHVQRFYGKGEPGVVSDLNATLDILAGSTKAVHVSLNRYDFEKSEPHIDSRDDAKRLLGGNVSGMTKDILDAVIELGHAQNYTVEMTLQGMKDLTGFKKSKDLIPGYHQISETLRDYIVSNAK